jgi:hypothetical protein
LPSAQIRFTRNKAGHLDGSRARSPDLRQRQEIVRAYLAIINGAFFSIFVLVSLLFLAGFAVFMAFPPEIFRT